MNSTAGDPIFFVSGATGTGKSSLAIELAVYLKSARGHKEVVIVNCDVMQFYRDLPVATNKAPQSETKGIPHVFLGFLNADDSYYVEPEVDYYGTRPVQQDVSSTTTSTLAGGPFTIHVYLDRVTTFVDNFFKEHPNGAVIVCGGTCYYLQAILFDNVLVGEGEGRVGAAGHRTDASFPDCDEADGRQAWKRLVEVDPVIAQKYHPNDTRRIQRLLEIHRETGKAPSEVFDPHQARLRYPPERTFFVWTWVERESLTNRLRTRVDEMVREGLLTEIEQFRAKIPSLTQTGVIEEAIGYKEFATVTKDELSAGETSARVVQALEKVKSDTIQYARKQERWLSNRISVLLGTASPTLPLNHFVRVDLGAHVEKNDLIESLAAVLFSEKATNRPPPSFYFPLASVEVTRPEVTQETCELCRMIVYGRGQMEAHLSSKRHRGALKRQKLERDQLEKYGRVIPPRKRGRES